MLTAYFHLLSTIRYIIHAFMIHPPMVILGAQLKLMKTATTLVNKVTGDIVQTHVQYRVEVILSLIENDFQMPSNKVNLIIY